MPLTLTTFAVATISGKAAGTTGQIVASIGPVPTTRFWRVEMVTVQVTGSTTTDTVCYLYDRAPDGNPVPAQATRYGNLTVDDQNSPITLPAGASLFVVWEGAKAGAVGRARVQYTVYKGTNAGAPTPVAA